MKAQVIPIGNSKGLRIPRALLELCRIGTAVNLELEGNAIVIRPIERRPREGWDAAFKAMHDRHEDRMLLPDGLDLDVGHWEW